MDNQKRNKLAYVPIGRIVVSKKNETYLKIASDNNGLLMEIWEHFTIVIENSFKRFNTSKKWNGKIRLFNMKTKTLYCGLLNELKKYCDNNHIELIIEDDWTVKNNFTPQDFTNFLKEVKKDLPNHIKFRDYQIKAFMNAMQSKRRLIVSATSSGKSFMIYLMIRFYLKHINPKGNIILIVPTTHLVFQMEKDFIEYGLKDFMNIQKIVGGESKDVKNNIVISTFQSINDYNLSNKDINSNEYFEKFDFVLDDEVHKAEANTIKKIMEYAINAEYRIGTTGTLKDTELHIFTLTGLFGKVYKAISTREMIDRNFASDIQLRVIFLKYSNRPIDFLNYHKELDFISEHVNRRKFITAIVKKLKGNTLLMFKRRNHGKILTKMIKTNIPERAHKVFYIDGDKSKTSLEKRMKIFEYINNNDGCVLVTSFSLFGTGSSIPNLNNGIYVDFIKSKIAVLQGLGRLLRKPTNSDEPAYLFDIIDDLRYTDKSENYSWKHGKERLKYYIHEKHKIKTEKFTID